MKSVPTSSRGCGFAPNSNKRFYCPILPEGHRQRSHNCEMSGCWNRGFLSNGSSRRMPSHAEKRGHRRSKCVCGKWIFRHAPAVRQFFREPSCAVPKTKRGSAVFQSIPASGRRKGCQKKRETKRLRFSALLSRCVIFFGYP